MAYREAKTDAEKKRGKSTDELSFEEALSFFKKRGKEKGASKFRWRGDAYNLDGEKIGGFKKTKGTTSSKGSATSAPESSARPKQRQKGRGEPNYGEAANKPTETPMGGPRRGRKPSPTRDMREDSDKNSTTLLRSTSEFPSYDTWDKMTRAERRAKGLPESLLGWQNQKWVEGYRKWKADRSSPSTGSSARKGTTSSGGGASGNFNKGGMVRKGNTNYKGKGMFYKSASPRGYK